MEEEVGRYHCMCSSLLMLSLRKTVFFPKRRIFSHSDYFLPAVMSASITARACLPAQFFQDRPGLLINEIAPGRKQADMAPGQDRSSDRISCFKDERCFSLTEKMSSSSQANGASANDSYGITVKHSFLLLSVLLEERRSSLYDCPMPLLREAQVVFATGETQFALKGRTCLTHPLHTVSLKELGSLSPSHHLATGVPNAAR
jgi:hypothetical protein